MSPVKEVSLEEETPAGDTQCSEGLKLDIEFLVIFQHAMSWQLASDS